MFKKFAALAAAAALSLGVMTGCGASGTTADSTGYSAENPLVLTLAHGLSETHTVHIAMTQFAEEVNEKTDGRIQVKIFPNGPARQRKREPGAAAGRRYRHDQGFCPRSGNVQRSLQRIRGIL